MKMGCVLSGDNQSIFTISSGVSRSKSAKPFVFPPDSIVALFHA